MYSWEIDKDGIYSHPQFHGVALYCKGPAKSWTDESWELVCDEEECDHTSDMCYYYIEPEEFEDEERVVVVMVGDDWKHTVYAEDLTKIDEEDYCHGCGQIGCGHS
jgi:hypothetical protein